MGMGGAVRGQPACRDRPFSCKAIQPLLLAAAVCHCTCTHTASSSAPVVVDEERHRRKRGCLAAHRHRGVVCMRSGAKQAGR